MRYKLFDPRNCKPSEYRKKYPELADVEEFTELSVTALIFVWWYANPTSDLVLGVANKKQRVTEALEKSGYNPGRAEKDRMLDLKFPERIVLAIDKMQKFDPGARFRGYKMINNIMQQYELIISSGPDSFTRMEGKGEEAEEVVDYQKYVNTSSKIAETVPMLIEKMESGFGVTLGDAGSEEEVGDAMHTWHMNRTDDDN